MKCFHSHSPVIKPMTAILMEVQRSSFENPLVLYSELANTIYSMNLEEAYAVKRLIPVQIHFYGH